MNSSARTALHGRKAVQKLDKNMKEMKIEKKTGNSVNKPIDFEKGTMKRGQSRREKKIALQQDVDKLRKKLRHEENVHRALERAFTRPLGVLPRLPPFLPSHTLELLAEVAVLEEEVVRLEEQVVNFRQGIYHEAIYISSSKRIKESSDTAQIQPASNHPNNGKQPTKLLNSTVVFTEDCQGKEHKLNFNFARNNKRPLTNKVPRTKVGLLDAKKTEEQCHWLTDKLRPETTFHSASYEDAFQDSNSPNKLSEDILKCLMNIFLRMNSMMSRDDLGTSPSTSGFRDPYCICEQFGKRDIGPYKHLRAIEVKSTSSDHLKSSTFLIRRLKLLLRRLASVNLSQLSHQQKLAFWINIYNSCMMNSYLEQGIPSSPEMIVALMSKAMVNVGGHLLTAMTIEHFILRSPYRAKPTLPKGSKCDEITMRGIFGLDWPEPLVTFALSCGSWSSPAVRVYTAEQVENELQTVKKDYLQAAVGISLPDKLAIPKLLVWYRLDFAKDVDSLVDWVCLQLPSELRREAVKFLDESRSSVSQRIQVVPYEFRFRYLLAP